MIYALDILLIVASYILSSLIIVMNGTVQPYFQKYGVQKVVIARVVANLAVSLPVMYFFPTAFAVVGVAAVAFQVWSYKELKKTLDQWSRV